MEFELSLLPHQAAFCEDVTTRDLALVGGRGCGKTYSLAVKLVTLAAIHAGQVGAALSPTGPMATKVLIPDLLDCMDRMKVKYDYNKTDRKFSLRFGLKTSTMYVLSAENVRDGLGLNLAFFGCDEFDTVDPAIATDSWRKLSGALRAGKPEHRQKVAVSTPEGFSSFMYTHWVQEVKDAGLKLLRKDLAPQQRLDLEQVCRRTLIRGRTLDNPFITDDVIADLRATYPPHFLAAYLEGEFVSLSTGPVYPHYDPNLNGTGLTLETLPSDVQTLHLGWDFNVVNPVTHPYGIAVTTAAVINGRPYVLDEIHGHSRTVEAIAEVKRRYPRKTIMCYPDATATGTRTSASESDRAQLNQAGFIDMSPMGNPRVQDRVNSVNALILNGNGERRLLINRERCPILSSCLLQQSYDARSGEPEKKSGFDDFNDSLGYLANCLFPIKRRELGTHTLRV